MKTVALDAMGGDNAPEVEVAGALAAAKSGEVRVVLVGDERELTAELRRQGGASNLPVEVRHASQVITMQDHPSSAVRRKTDASMRVAFNLVKDREADAVVSAGNSGAMLACGLFVLKRLPGVDRPAILTTFPTRGGNAALLDMGANVDCKPLHLIQFAVMGACFARMVHTKPRPAVGVLSNGSEEHKGTDLTREASAALREHPSKEFEYLGYVEGRDIFSGRVDVVVCDGFSGNLVLKVTEGAAETLIGVLKREINAGLLSRLFALGLLPTFRRVKAFMDYAEQGGAPLLGVDGVAIICHGGSNAKAIKNALLGGARYANYGLSGAIHASLDEHGSLVASARGKNERPAAEESAHEESGGAGAGS
jgi:glycerol-3-phosphate acyltransferase PlsX